MPVEKFLTVQEVAKKLRVSERTITRYIKSGKLRASKLGQWRIQESDLQLFFNTYSNLRRSSQKYGKRKK